MNIRPQNTDLINYPEHLIVQLLKSQCQEGTLHGRLESPFSPKFYTSVHVVLCRKNTEVFVFVLHQPDTLLV